MNGDDPGETRELVKVRLRVQDFASPDLFPDDVRELGQQDIQGMQIELTVQQLPRLLAQRLGHKPLEDDAGVDGQLHRSRSSRNSVTLSV